jgi:3-oxoacyl-[acyl-carrier protein] reductase
VKLNMKNALVTGGSRGIGKAICVKLASEGYHIIINYVSNDEAAAKALEAVNAAGGTGELLKFDVGDAEAVSGAVKGWQEAHPDEFIEVLVNNAGIRKDNLMLWMEPDDWYKVIRTNLDSFYNVTKQVLQPMVVHKRGRIVNMASLSGLKGLPGQTNYSAAKGGIIAATKALAQEVAGRKVTVNAVAPGFIKTDMVEGLDEAALKKTIPAGRFGEPEEVAELVAFLVSDKAAYISGQTISINGAMYE